MALDDEEYTGPLVSFLQNGIAFVKKLEEALEKDRHGQN